MLVLFTALQCLLEVRWPELLTVSQQLGLHLLPEPHDLICAPITAAPTNLHHTLHELHPLFTFFLRRATRSLIGIIFVWAFHDA